MSVKRLWACWQAPRGASSEPLLSFLPPGEDDDLRKRWTGPVLSAREASRNVARSARETYVRLVAEIGAAPLSRDGPTLRQALAPEGRASLWWYHPVSAKDCESDPTFNRIIAIQAILRAAREEGCDEIVLWGAPAEVREALRPFRKISAFRTRPRPGALFWSQCWASRAKLALSLWRQKRALARLPRVQPKSFSAALYGFWDWSFWKDGARLKDRYVDGLPAALERQGLPAAYLAWLDPGWEPGKEKRPLREALAPLAGRDDVVILQNFLTAADAARAAANLRPLALYLGLRGEKSFRALFERGGADYYPLFQDHLLAGFIDARLPRLALCALACERAFSKHRPKLAVSFLEHFPFARAFFEGARRAGGVFTAAVQHACYNGEKTFLFIDPRLEFAGEPDDCALPRPEAACVMGSSGRELFAQCGYETSALHQTGSPRYDHLRAPAELPPAPPREEGKLRLLLLLSLDTDLEMDMVEAACLAASPDDEILARDHPFGRLTEHPRFSSWAKRVRRAEASLDQNLARADVALFTYSGAAEESFIKGKATWQWLPLGYEASALAEAVRLPRFSTVAALRERLADLRKNPTAHAPTPEDRRVAYERIFAGSENSSAAETIAATLAREVIR